MTTSPPRLLDLNASIHNNLFIEPLFLSIKITFMIMSVKRCPLPSLIATLRHALAKTTYQRSSTLIHPIIRLIGAHSIKPSQLINLARLVSPHYINRTNQILFTKTIKEAIKKGYIKSVVKKLIYILRASI